MANIRQKSATDKQRKVTSFLYDRVCLLPSEQIGAHTQQTWELCHIVRGRGVRVIGDCQEAFVDGEVVLIPPRILHCWHFDAESPDDEIENICLQINDEWLQHLAENVPETVAAVKHIRSLDSAVKYNSTAAQEIASAMTAMQCETPLQQLA